MIGPEVFSPCRCSLRSSLTGVISYDRTLAVSRIKHAGHRSVQRVSARRARLTVRLECIAMRCCAQPCRAFGPRRVTKRAPQVRFQPTTRDGPTVGREDGTRAERLLSAQPPSPRTGYWRRDAGRALMQAQGGNSTHRRCAFRTGVENRGTLLNFSSNRNSTPIQRAVDPPTAAWESP